MESQMKLEEKRRYYLLDAVRGICILGMIVYHTLFDIVAFFGVPVNESFLVVVNIIRDFGACCFICLSGICIHFGGRPLKRVIKLFVAGFIVSLVSFFAVPDMPIYFGILTFMGIAGLLMIPLKNLLDKLPPVFMTVLCFTLFMLSFEISDGYIGYYGLFITSLPEFLYKNLFTAFFGFPFIGFATSDYYPLMPWIFMFFFGFFLWKVMKKSDKLMNFFSFRVKALEKVGKWSLYIYMAHQPVIMGVLLLIFYFVGQ